MRVTLRYEGVRDKISDQFPSQKSPYTNTLSFCFILFRDLSMKVDLDDPEQRIGRISRTSKWEVTSAMWNPHKSHAEYFVTATNLKVLMIRSETSSDDVVGF